MASLPPVRTELPTSLESLKRLAQHHIKTPTPQHALGPSDPMAAMTTWQKNGSTEDLSTPLEFDWFSRSQLAPIETRPGYKGHYIQTDASAPKLVPAAIRYVGYKESLFDPNPALRPEDTASDTNRFHAAKRELEDQNAIDQMIDKLQAARKGHRDNYNQLTVDWTPFRNGLTAVDAHEKKLADAKLEQELATAKADAEQKQFLIDGATERVRNRLDALREEITPKAEQQIAAATVFERLGKGEWTKSIEDFSKSLEKAESVHSLKGESVAAPTNRENSRARRARLKAEGGEKKTGSTIGNFVRGLSRSNNRVKPGASEEKRPGFDEDTTVVTGERRGRATSPVSTPVEAAAPKRENSRARRAREKAEGGQKTGSTLGNFVRGLSRSNNRVTPGAAEEKRPGSQDGPRVSEDKPRKSRSRSPKTEDTNATTPAVKKEGRSAGRVARADAKDKANEAEKSS
jgi:hypothetical protein